MKDAIHGILKQHHSMMDELMKDDSLIQNVEVVVQEMISVFRNKGRVFFCGNGGSAADAQHLAAELSGRFYLNRAPLFAEALHVNSSYITAVANDFSFDQVYSRILEAKGQEGDLLYAISTSGNSTNVIEAVKKAKEIGMKSIGTSCSKTNPLLDLCDFSLRIPSEDTPRIQEAQILIGHIICQLVEAEIFGSA